MELRQSDLKQFGTCARSFYYSRILGLGNEYDVEGSLTVLGSVWHYAVDVYETFGNDLPLAKQTFRYYWTNPQKLGLNVDFWHRKTTFKGLMKRGLEMLDRYHELEPWRTGRLLGTEVQFRVRLGEHWLNGTVDKLYVRPQAKKIEVLDFKTGRFVPEKLKYNIQFTAYCYATTRPEFWQFVPGHEDAWEQYREYQRSGWWYHARNNKMFNAGNRGPADYQRLALAADEMNKAIESEVFPLDYSGESCGYCPYVEEICGSEMPDPQLIGLEER